MPRSAIPKNATTAVPSSAHQPQPWKKSNVSPTLRARARATKTHSRLSRVGDQPPERSDSAGRAPSWRGWPSTAGGRVLVVAVVAVVVVGAWQWVQWDGRTADANVKGPSANMSEVGLSRFAPADRVAAPPLDGRTLDNGQLDLADLKGHVVVVNIWGSWCGPCRGEAPDLANASRTTEPWGAKFVGVDTRDTDAAARAFVRAFDIPYPSIVDNDGSKLLPFTGIVPLSAVPSTMVIDPDGRIAATVVGVVTYRTLVGLIRDELPHSVSSHETRS